MWEFINFVKVEWLFFILVVLLATLISNMIFKSVIDILFSKLKSREGQPRIASKTRTIRRLLKGMVSATIYFIGLIIILSKIGINVLPLITGAGFLGLAFSLGSQTLIKDIIAGIFIITENQYNIGEKVKIGDHTGEVYNLTLRTTVLRDRNKNLIYIPNSSIVTVIRYTEDGD